MSRNEKMHNISSLVKTETFSEAQVNFKKETIYMKMAPKAKTPEFFSLATPIKINGTFKDFGLDLSMVSLVGTVISFITSPVHVPIRRALVDNYLEMEKMLV